MPEYIKREAVCSKCKNKSHCEVSFDEKQKCPVYKAPTADVAEVKHGEWELYFDGKELMCSVCKATFWDECGNGGTNYCPNCGAKMDGGKNV